MLKLLESTAHEEDIMTIKRFETGARMSQAVVHNGTVYLAGQVAKGATRERSDDRDPEADRLAARRGGLGQDEAALGDHLARQHGHVRGDELGLGAVGFAGQYAGSRDRGIEAGRARLSRRDRGDRRRLTRTLRFQRVPKTRKPAERRAFHFSVNRTELSSDGADAGPPPRSCRTRARPSVAGSGTSGARWAVRAGRTIRARVGTARRVLVLCPSG